MLARKSVKQSYQPSPQILSLMDNFREMTNDCIRIGLENDASTLKRLSRLNYNELRRYHVPSYYRLCAISKAAGILSARRKSIRRGYPAKDPYVSKPVLVSCYGFRIEDGSLHIPIGDREYESIPLNAHTLSILSEPVQVRSFTLTPEAVSLCISKNIAEIECTKAAGLDRNRSNLTYGNSERVIQYNLSKANKMVETTKETVSSFKRNDARIRKEIASKYGKRRRNRIGHLLNCVTKDIVSRAHENREAIVLENIKGIRNLYRRGNGQGRRYRSMMNSWSFGEAQRQVEYKAAWEGVPVIHLTKGETRGTTVDCARCGERLQSPAKDDVRHRRQLWCQKCGRWIDRDVNAVINQAVRGRLRFDRSLPQGEAKGGAGEAVKGNTEHEGKPLILRVDASKLLGWSHI